MIQERKILIVGDAGRGKTTLAHALSKKIGIDFHSTDDFYWEKKFTKKADKIESKNKLGLIYALDKWIVDGSTHDLMADGLPNADLIIHLRFRNLISQYFVLLRRHLSRDNESLKNLFELLRHVTYKRYSIGYLKGVKTTLETILPFKKKVITLSSYKEINNFLKQI
jgi:adenylate kinase family enzyme